MVDNLYVSGKYLAELAAFARATDLSYFRGKRLLITGGTGLLMSYLIDVLARNNIDCELVLYVRDIEAAKKRFTGIPADSKTRLHLIKKDLIADDLTIVGPLDLIIHAASTVDPQSFVTDAIKTLMLNISTLEKLLKMAVDKNSQVLFISSDKIYGQTKIRPLTEKVPGEVDVTDIRSCYGEGKRAGEMLGLCYQKQFAVDFCAVRLARTYGPTIKLTDGKVLSQFIVNGLLKKPLVLKSAGTQAYSYCYVADAINAIVRVLTESKPGEVYNVAGRFTLGASLLKVVEHIGRLTGQEVISEEAKANERQLYSSISDCVMDISKLEELGYQPRYDIYEGLENTLAIMKEIVEN